MKIFDNFRKTTLCLILGMISLNLTYGQNCTLPIEIAITHVTCPGAKDGGATAVVLHEDGTLNDYYYEWSNGAITPSISNMPGGEYSVIVYSKHHDCKKEFVFQINEPGQVYVDADIGRSAYCWNNGTADIYVYDDQFQPITSYSISWSDPTLMGSTQTNLAPGVHSLTVTVANCQFPFQFTIDATEQLNVVLSASPNNVISPSQPSVTLNASVSGGNPPYDYEWLDPVTTAVYHIGPSLVVNSPGFYYFRAVDDDDCSLIKSIRVEGEIPEEGEYRATIRGQVYPNPTTEAIHVPVQKGKNVITIYDLQGKIVLEKTTRQFTKGMTKVLLPPDLEGAYLLKNTDEFGRTTISQMVQIH